MLGLQTAGQTKRCNWCRQSHATSAFSANPKTGVLYSKCDACRPKAAAAQKTFGTSSKGRAVKSKFLQSSKGEAEKERMKKVKKSKFECSSAFSFNNKMLCAASHLLSGRTQTSPRLINSSSFSDVAHFLKVVLDDVQRKGFEFKDYGVTWQLDHKIPREAFDFDDPEDVKRCWSPKNVHVMSSADNKAKSVKLIDHYLLEAGVENFPRSWHGQLPDKELKREFYKKWLAHREAADSASYDIVDNSTFHSGHSEPDSE